MNKKIGILTFHWANHYGAVLQAYALRKLLRVLGWDANIINFEPALSSIVSFTIRPDRLGRKYKTLSLPLSRTLRSMAGEFTYYLPTAADELKRAKAFNEFRKKILGVHTETTRNLNELKSECLKYSAVIIGSDQVWNPEFLKFSDYAYLLPFDLKDVRKVAFSASIGVKISAIPDKMVTLYMKCLKNFSFISVRESIHARWLSEILDREVYHTLDPTLLVEREDLEEVAQRFESVPERYVLFYNLDASILPFVEEIEKLTGFPVLFYREPTIREWRFYSKWVKGRRSFYCAGPQEFIYLLRNAELIFTNSFHGLTLSILFEKPLLIVIKGTASRAESRIEDIIKMLGLSEIVIKTRSDIRRAFRAEVNYRDIKLKLSKLKSSSINLLKKSLSMDVL